MKMISTHFSLAELTTTQHRGIDNSAPPEVMDNLILVANTLENVRELVGPIRINSGYRCKMLNAVIGGQNKSQHCEGLAVDFIAPSCTLQQVAQRIIEQKVQFDQLIYEFGSWIHISHAPNGRVPRGDILMIGGWTSGKYLPLDLNKVPQGDMV